MNILSDPCCLGAIVLLVIYGIGIGELIAAIVAEYRRDPSETLDEGRN